jgi:hypothetical protein
LLRVPAHLLAETEYIIGITINASAGKKEKFVSVNDALSFQVVDAMQGEISARGDYVQNFAGVVRPRLAWEISDVQS